jgi:RNA polymerase sigma-70 factor (ECF subfamily)
MSEFIDVDEQLVASLKSREDGAYRDLVERFTPKLYPVVMRILNNSQDAEDALQDTFISCWKGISRFDGRSKFGSWIHRVAVNASFKRLRKDFDHRGHLPIEEAARHVATDVPTLEALGPVWQAVAAMPNDLSQIVRLKYIEELSSDEIAAELGLTSENVRQKLHRARIALATKLQPILCPSGDVTCGGDLGLLMDLIDGTLSSDLLIPVRSHIDGCPGCAASEVGFTWLAKLMAAHLDVIVPLELADRLIQTGASCLAE